MSVQYSVRIRNQSFTDILGIIAADKEALKLITFLA